MLYSEVKSHKLLSDERWDRDQKSYKVMEEMYVDQHCGISFILN